jgi:hypothetical protein
LQIPFESAPAIVTLVLKSRMASLKPEEIAQNIHAEKALRPREE